MIGRHSVDLRGELGAVRLGRRLVERQQEVSMPASFSATVLSCTISRSALLSVMTIGLRRAERRIEAEPHADVEARHADLGRGRHVGQRTPVRCGAVST